ncbi:MAG: allantoinase AllB [Acidimicrobiia bacterium]|nr:allantoinase AllB [Acidimicrobiia bacterium]
MWDDWVIAGEKIVFPTGTAPGWIHILDGVIAAVGTIGDPMPASRLFHVADRVVLPGLVDPHVHVNEPGRTQWEGYETATRAAAAGGTTTIVDMPVYSLPPTTTVAALEKKRKATKTLTVDVAFWGGIVLDNRDELAGLAAEGVAGFKAFLTSSGVDEFGWLNARALEAAAEAVADLGLPLIVHAEDLQTLAAPRRRFSALPPSERRTYRSYLESRPSHAEDRAVATLIEASRRFGVPVHVSHLASADSVTMIASAQREGLAVSAETCPHYLVFSAEDVPEGATVFKCAPPIREERHRLGLWQALIDGSISVVASDHSPSPPDLKALDSGDFGEAWAGIASLELRLPLLWTAGQPFSIQLEDLALWLATAPARLAGIDTHKGEIAVGKHADLAVFDTGATWTVAGAELHQRHPLTPYDGMEVRGRVTETFLRGQPVFADDNLSHDMLGTRLLRDLPIRSS